ncbi:hypothetical protein GOM71_07095 [Paenibacillus sp. NEAU-GSW1]|nr:hypothetical protein [Paenibacillus sp. NEAU-GSW1]
MLTVNEPSGKKTVYTYDGAGNREQETVTEGTTIAVTSYVYNDQNRLIETDQLFSEGRQEKTTYQYDNNGNMTGKNREIIKQVYDEETDPSFGMFIYGQESENPNVQTLLEGIGTYEYDVWNQLSKSTAGSVTSSYRYNAEGYRTYKKVGESEAHYLYEADKVVLETNNSEKETAFNLYGINLVSRIMGSEKYYYLYNGHADVTALVDVTGIVKVAYEYDAFGNVTLESGADINNPIRYAGYQYDEESKLYYLNARYYDPKLARFITEDTYKGEIEDPLSLNLYTYVYNNPIIYIDPSGNVAIGVDPELWRVNGLINEQKLKWIAANAVNDKDGMKAANAEAVRLREENSHLDGLLTSDDPYQTVHYVENSNGSKATEVRITKDGHVLYEKDPNYDYYVESHRTTHSDKAQAVAGRIIWDGAVGYTSTRALKWAGVDKNKKTIDITVAAGGGIIGNYIVDVLTSSPSVGEERHIIWRTNKKTGEISNLVVVTDGRKVIEDRFWYITKKGKKKGK